MPPRPGRTTFVRLLPVLAALVLGACASKEHRGVSPDHALASRLATNDAAVAHFLNRATFGARPQDIEAVRQAGFDTILDRQLHPERVDDSALEKRLAAFETLNLSSKQIAEQYYQPAQQARRLRQMMQSAAASVATQNAGAPAPPSSPRPVVSTAADQELFRRERLVLQELSEQKIIRAVYSERQLQEVLVDFWFNHFNVFAGKGADRGLLTAYERDVIRPHVFGKFRDLLGATAESPAMLFYLDNWMSVDPDGPHPLSVAAPGSRLRARPAAARPVPIGSARPIAGGAPGSSPKRNSGLNENYARELLELHTLGVDGGYTQQDVVAVARCFTGWTIAAPRDGGDFRFDVRRHDVGQKVVLGHIIKAGGGKEDGDKVLDILARDPHTARFVATKMLRRFVADDPPAALIDRVARRFRETDGDLREVYRAIFVSPDFWSEQANASKVKTPLEFVVSALRASAAEVNDATSAVQALRALGMPLYFCQPPTGYVDRADAWVNTGSLLNRMNFALALVGNRMAGVRVDLDHLAGTGDLAAARTRLVSELLDNEVSATTLSALSRAATIPQLAALTLGAPEFQKR